MELPKIEFLKEVENMFSTHYPKTYINFCMKYIDNKDLLKDYPTISKGKFITDCLTSTIFTC